jgi:integrase
LERSEFDPWTGEDPRAVWSGDSRDGESGDSPSLESPTLTTTIERFIDRKKREGRKQTTLDTYRGIWRRFRRSAGAERLSELSASDVSAFVHDESVSQATRRKRYRHVCAVLRSADRDELTSGVPTPRYDEKLPTPIRPGEFERIIGAVKAEYREKRREHHIRRGSLVWTIPAFRFLFNSGLRAGELAALRWRDIDRERSLVLVREQKNGRAETVPLVGGAESALRHAPRPRGPEMYVFRTRRGSTTERSESAFARRLSRRFSSARDRAGVSSEKTLHDLRAGFATRLADAGLTAHKIKRALRHSSLKMALRYVRLSNRELRSEMEEAFS